MENTEIVGKTTQVVPGNQQKRKLLRHLCRSQRCSVFWGWCRFPGIIILPCLWEVCRGTRASCLSCCHLSVRTKGCPSTKPDLEDSSSASSDDPAWKPGRCGLTERRVAASQAPSHNRGLHHHAASSKSPAVHQPCLKLTANEGGDRRAWYLTYSPMAHCHVGPQWRRKGGNWQLSVLLHRSSLPCNDSSACPAST